MTDKNNIPKHIAIIIDGNGRWAKEKGLSRSDGHREGIERIKEIIGAANKLGLKAITFFAFSTENWDRPKNEVNMLMRYLNNFLDRQIGELIKNNIRFKVIGENEPIPKYLQEKIRDVQLRTKDNTGLVVNIALNYGARQEIVNAAKRFASAVTKGQTRIESLDTEEFGRLLYTADLPDPDLLIRTSGEMRLSNFLLWQLSYAELYFPKKYWPDFKTKDLEEAVQAYQKRERRFGSIDVPQKSA
jgi:undecaprenyl diphosphate synthase